MLARIACLTTAALTLSWLCPIAAASIDPRTDDARVATIAYRLATADINTCRLVQPTLGLELWHLGQFSLSQRPGVIARYRLDVGPSIAVVVAGGPAAAAGVRPGDVLLRINGVALPVNDRLDRDFDQKHAQAYADRLTDEIEAAAKLESVGLDLLRDGRTVRVRVAPRPACLSRVHLARSGQANAFADGLHVLVTTRIVAMARSDDELAFVLAHEMAHNILQHAAEMRAKRGSRGLFRTGRIVRRTEREADLLGADITRAAGYDADGAAEVLRVVDRGPLHLSFLDGHDGAASRIAAIRAHLASHPPGPAGMDAGPIPLQVDAR